MEKIHVSVTAARTDVDNQFKGTITFRNEKSEELVIGYVDSSPSDEIYDLEFSDKDEKFEIKGKPSREIFDAMSNKQKYIIGLSFELLAKTIQNSKNLGLSNQTTQMLRAFNGDASGKMESTLEVDEDCYKGIFGMVTAN